MSEFDVRACRIDIFNEGHGEVEVRITHLPSGYFVVASHPQSALVAREDALQKLRFLVETIQPLADDQPHHLPGTKAEHAADFDFDHWWVGKYGESSELSADSAIFHYMRQAFRAGWEAHAEEMNQQAMSRSFRE